MKRKTENKIVLIVRKTRLEELIERFNTEDQARFYIEHLGEDFSEFKDEHLQYLASMKKTMEILDKLGRVQVLDRSYVPNFVFGSEDSIVVLGQDGLVANVLKYLDGQPVIGVNPDPSRLEGVLLPFTVSDIGDVMTEVFQQASSINLVTMAKVELNTGETLHAVNDFFIGPKSHTSARYTLSIGGKEERQSSSGIIVSTGLGSSGWLRSILAGAQGISESVLNRQIKQVAIRNFGWDSNYLYFSVREPWPSKTSSADITFGKITQKNNLEIVSKMPENGVIFSDGIEKDFLPFTSGTRAKITIASRKGYLVR